MAQTTEAERVQRIKQLLAQVNKMPPERHETIRLPDVGGEERLCQVITIGVDEVLLNHSSHRIRAQLDDDPEWLGKDPQALGLRNDPHGEAAQRVIQRHVAAARTVDEFAALKESLQREGQTEPGVMTHKGVLINANTRVVALRELEDPAKRYIRVAVLPETVHPGELALLELRLQMQKVLKVAYTLTNELLFIEELATVRKLSHGQIARELRIFPESQKKGENEVRTRLRVLSLVRQMQTIPEQPLPLTFFDQLKLEQFRELHRSYYALVEQDPQKAQRHLKTFLLSVAVGVTSVHQMRWVDPEFIGDYMIPQLEEDELIGGFADRLVSPSTAEQDLPAGVQSLLTAGKPTPDEADIGGLINILTRRDKRVEVEGTSIVMDREDIKGALKSAILTGIKEKRRDESEADKLEAPIDALRNAVRQLDRCAEACNVAFRDPDFDAKHRKALEAAFKKLKRTYRALEAQFVKSNVISE